MQQNTDISNVVRASSIELNQIVATVADNQDQRTNCTKNMLTTVRNTRFVTNISMGCCIKPSTKPNRFQPYNKQKDRHRTMSENYDSADNNSVSNLAKNLVNQCIDDSLAEIVILKQAKPLDRIVSGHVIDKITNMKSFELEEVAESIKNLNVVE